MIARTCTPYGANGSPCLDTSKIIAGRRGIENVGIKSSLKLFSLSQVCDMIHEDKECPDGLIGNTQDVCVEK